MSAILDTFGRLYHESRKRWMGEGLPIKAVRIGMRQHLEMTVALEPYWLAVSDHVQTGGGSYNGIRYYLDERFNGVEIEFIEGDAHREYVARAVAEELGLPCRAI